MPHGHPIGEFCPDCKPIMMADFGAGERFWKHWATPNLKFSDGRKVRYKILSKKTEAKVCPFEFICLREEGGLKKIFAQGLWQTNDQLAAFVQGVEATLSHLGGQEGPYIKFEVMDFSGCDTLEKWEYKVREGTLWDVWSETAPGKD